MPVIESVADQAICILVSLCFRELSTIMDGGWTGRAMNYFGELGGGTKSLTVHGGREKTFWIILIQMCVLVNTIAQAKLFCTFEGDSENIYYCWTFHDWNWLSCP